MEDEVALSPAEKYERVLQGANIVFSMYKQAYPKYPEQSCNIFAMILSFKVWRGMLILPKIIFDGDGQAFPKF